MDGLSEVFTKMSLSDYKIGEHYWVHVTHINHPHDFYIRPADYKYNMGLLERRGDRIRTAELIPGRLLIFKSSLLNKYIRGQVLQVHQGDSNVRHCDMLAIDYGCTEYNVSLKGIHKIENDTCFPPLVVNCQLANCKPQSGNSFDSEAILAMKTFVGTERARMFVKTRYKHQLIVELINTCPDEIGTLLALTNYTTMGNDGQKAVSKIETSVIHNKKIKYPMVVVGEVLHVRVQSALSLGGFYVAKSHSFKQFLINRNDFSDYCRNQKELTNENVMLGSLVGVLTQTSVKYERAIITQIKPNNRIVLQLIDWGNTIEVNLYQLRLVKTDSFFNEPALAIYCTVESIDMSNDGLKTCLHPGYEFFIQIISVGDSVNIPHSVSIIQIFKK